jgi:hypothetical protein
MRQLVIDNGPASPFQQILAWLAKEGDYFTAASVALDLLQDGDTLFHLWKNAEMVDEQEEQSKLDGLLDGIIPIQLVVENHDSSHNDTSHTSIDVVHLADMTVGCLIKGGVSMAETLRLFLRENQFYDPARACLMLAATTARILGDAIVVVVEEVVATTPWNGIDDLLWPVECMLQIGLARDYLDTVLMLLNVTIPDELRNRRRQEEHEDQNIPMFGLEMTKTLIIMIVSCDVLAIDILLDLVDETSHVAYWKSLSDETKLELSLIQVGSFYPMIQNPEIRAWVRDVLNLCLKQITYLPTVWLQKLAIACLTNAGCDLTDFEMDQDPVTTLDSTSVSMVARTGSVPTFSASRLTDKGKSPIWDDGNDDDGLEALKMEIVETRNALIPTSEGPSLDFDLLIPCLLQLQARQVHWWVSDPALMMENRHVPNTQTLLDAACYLAGRCQAQPNLTVMKKAVNVGTIVTPTRRAATDEEDDDDDDACYDEKPFLFADFDSSTAMKQCFLTGNVSAGANLIGGRNGFILQVCQVLYENIGNVLSIGDAERLILEDQYFDGHLIESLWQEKEEEEMSSSSAPFQLRHAHRKLLLLLDEHVLSVKTFGEFETVHIRGRVEPVFAARSVFRAWLLLGLRDIKTSSKWLSQWLARRLEIGPSSYKSTPTKEYHETAQDPLLLTTTSSSDTIPVHHHHHYHHRHHQKSSISSSSSSFKGVSGSRHRLACAAIARALIWPPSNQYQSIGAVTAAARNDTTNTITTTTITFESGGGNSDAAIPLALVMEMELKFLIEICEACVGLVESVPPQAVEEMKILTDIP